MCRWVAYTGTPTYLETVISAQQYGLLDQARNARKGETRVNADGFGLAWYDIRETPGLYRNVLPAWADSNLQSLVHAVKAHTVLAHIRASTGTDIAHANCHPFSHGKWSFIHNGALGGYESWRRKVDAILPDDLYAERKGDTDSELLFLLMMQHIENGVLSAFEQALLIIQRVSEPGAVHRISAALSDGKSLYVIRYASDNKAPSLYYCRDGQNWLIASEPLTGPMSGWKAVKKQSLCTFDGISEPYGVCVHPHRHMDAQFLSLH